MQLIASVQDGNLHAEVYPEMTGQQKPTRSYMLLKLAAIIAGRNT